MLKNISILAVSLLTFFVLTSQAVFAAGGASAEEAAHAEPSGMLITLLTIMSFATLASMLYFSFRDNG